MIYLIKTEYKTTTLLKIGFSEDDSWKNRFNQYRLHNPLCELLGTIPEGTREHESKLHYKFHSFLACGREWFEYSEEIVNFFQGASLPDLDSLPLNPSFCKSNNHLLLKNRKVHTLLDYVLRQEGREDFTTDDFKDMLKVVSHSSTTPEEIFEDLQRSNHYPSIASKTWDEVECILYPPLPEKLTKFFEEYDKLKTWEVRIKFVCEYLIANPDHFDGIVGNLVDSDKIKQQLVTLGPGRIWSLGYNITRINQAMGITIFDRSSLDKAVYSSFTAGKRYTKKFIKAELGAIYSSADFKATPKANDIENWFEARRCKITIDGKQQEAFELIKVKPQ